ncbi:DMT family transporter [Paraburkholderia sacchari]|uniref:DMT family transporter n=1 Tax=Paraburkholderia sacchari TaxID=159450 RepID=A0A8T6Z4D2_9BURK|nr:DMT family transporter [Paraburkholderia sacchari]NLP59711.1 DMT family transporter [Paraburkholderia sacchari]
MPSSSPSSPSLSPAKSPRASSSRSVAHLQLTLAMITVGSTVIASKIIGAGLDPMPATALRFAFALPVLLVLMRVTSTAFPRPGLRDAGLLIAQAAIGSVGYTVFLIAGTQRTSAADAGIILGILPAVCALTAAVVLRERLRASTLIAVMVASLGVALVTLAPAAQHGGGSLTGDALLIGAVICESLFVLLNKRLATPWPPLALSAAMTGIGFVVSALAALPDWPATLHALPPHALLAVAYYALVPTVGGFWLWYTGASRVSGAEAAIFTAVAPVSGVVLAALLLGEPLTLARLAGLALVVAAVFVTAAPGVRGRSRQR